MCSIEGGDILRANTIISEVSWRFMKDGVVPEAMAKRKLSKKPVFSLTATIQPSHSPKGSQRGRQGRGEVQSPSGLTKDAASGMG